MTTNTTLKPTAAQQNALELLLLAEQNPRGENWAFAEVGGWYVARYGSRINKTTLDKLVKLGLLEHGGGGAVRLTDKGRAHLNAASADVEANAAPAPFTPQYTPEELAAVQAERGFKVGERVYNKSWKEWGNVTDVSNNGGICYLVDNDPNLHVIPFNNLRDLVHEADALEADEITIPVTALDALVSERDALRANPFPRPTAGNMYIPGLWKVTVGDYFSAQLVTENADELEQLRAENARLKAQLEAFNSHVIVRFDGEGSPDTYEVGKRGEEHVDSIGGGSIEVSILGWESSNPFHVGRDDVLPFTVEGVLAALNSMNRSINELEATNVPHPAPNGVSDGAQP